MAISIAAVKSKPGGPAVPDSPDGPSVDTAFKPKVAPELIPLALDAKEDFDRGHYADAESVYAKLLARDPQNPYLLSNQGVVLFREDKLKSAEVMLKKAVASAPKDPFGQATLGIVYYKMHRYDDAINSLTKAIQLDPKNATAHNYLGITSSQKGWPEAAIEEIQKAIALNPNYADAHFNIAVIYATNQPPSKDQAMQHYKIATSLGATPDAMLEKLLRN
jgi:tetratricopeptide (TPR) repeat protein